MTLTTIWAACGLNPDHSVYGAFEDLGSRLRSKNIALLLFTPGRLNRQFNGLFPIQVPFSVADFSTALVLPTSDETTLRELLSIEQAWARGGMIDADAVQRGMGVWDSVAELTRPCAILSWHTTPPLSHLHRRIADRRRAAWWSLEMGPLPETLDLSFGQVSRSNLATVLSMRRSESSDKEIDERIAELQSYYLQLVERHYPESNLPLSEERTRKLLSTSGSKILFIGSNDIACGAALSPPRAAIGTGERCSPFVASSQDALDLLAYSVASVVPGATIWVRPHPGETLSIDAVSKLGIKAELTVSEDLTWLIRHADVAACIASNAQLQLALWGKPQISFADGYLTGRGVAYDVRSTQDLTRGLAQALSAGGWTSRDRRGKELIALLFDRHLVGIKDETPTRLRIADLADLLVGFRDFAEPITTDADSLARDVTSLLDGSRGI